MIVIEYKTKTERDNIIKQKTAEGLFLVEDMITTKGSYLIFDDQPLAVPRDLEAEIDELKARIERLEIKTMK